MKFDPLNAVCIWVKNIEEKMSFDTKQNANRSFTLIASSSSRMINFFPSKKMCVVNATPSHRLFLTYTKFKK